MDIVKISEYYHYHSGILIIYYFEKRYVSIRLVLIGVITTEPWLH